MDLQAVVASSWDRVKQEVYFIDSSSENHQKSIEILIQLLFLLTFWSRASLILKAPYGLEKSDSYGSRLDSLSMGESTGKRETTGKMCAYGF